MFVLRDDGDSVNFRKNLAYSWIYNDAPEAEEGKTPELVAKDGALSLRVTSLSAATVSPRYVPKAKTATSARAIIVQNFIFKVFIY